MTIYAVGLSFILGFHFGLIYPAQLIVSNIFRSKISFVTIKYLRGCRLAAEGANLAAFINIFRISSSIVLPGSSCLGKILKNYAYDGIIGVACTDELKLGTDCLMELKIPALGVPLTKNGCSGTIFNLHDLKSIISESYKNN